MKNREQQPNAEQQQALNKADVIRRSNRAVMQCAKWLVYCLEIGYSKSQIDALEALWWEHHDEQGNLVRRNGC